MSLDNAYENFLHYLSIAYQLVVEIRVQILTEAEKYLVISLIYLSIGQSYPVCMLMEGSGYLME